MKKTERKFLVLSTLMRRKKRVFYRCGKSLLVSGNTPITVQSGTKNTQNCHLHAVGHPT